MAVMMFVSSYVQEGSLLKYDYFVIFVKRFQLLSLDTTHTLPGLFIILNKKQPTVRLLISTSGNSEWTWFSLACAIPGTFRNFVARAPIYVNSYFNITVKNWIARGSIV